MAVSSTGTTNLDVNAIVSQLMTAERRPLTLIAQQEARLQSQVSAWGNLKGALAGLQGAVQQLDRLERFSATKATVADTSVATAGATADAVPGTYSLEVLALAQQHKLNSAAFAATTDVVGTGTLTIQFGTYASGANTFTADATKTPKTVTIAAGQDSLAAIRDAINAADAGVSASIVNDASGHRLVLTSRESGAASSLKITVADGDGNHVNDAGLSRLAYDPVLAAGSGKNLSQAAAAQDASLKIDGLAMTSAGNSVGTAIEGVTLSLLKVNAGSPTTLAVQRDTQSVQKTVEGFIAAYNSASSGIRSLTSYNATTKAGGLLQGDRVAASLTDRLRGTLNTALKALTGTFTSLSDIGVSFRKDGTLALDAAKLQSAIASSPGEVAALFTSTARPSHPEHMSYGGATAGTKAGTYSINVTQVATQGKLTGAAAAGLVITAGVNDTVELEVNGVKATVTLSAATYASAAALAAELESKANAAAAFDGAGIDVSVGESAGVLTVTSSRYGSDSTVAVTGSAGATGLFGAAPASTAGVDVGGTIDGVAGTGQGRTLTGADGQACEGLALELAVPSTGDCGTVCFSIGYAAQLSRLIDDLMAATGTVAGRTAGLDAQIKALDRREAQVNDRLAETEKRYRAQFIALDAMLARMNTTSSFLTSQLASLPGAGS